MISAVFYGKGDIRIAEMPMPAVGPQDVLIKVMACGVCGTDVHIFEGDKGAADTTSPVILGHEFAGVVESVGTEVQYVKPGDRVCVDPNQLCGRCGYCRDGIGHFCENMVGIGTTVNGGFAQYCAVRESQVSLLADSVSFEEGAMAEPLACCLHGMDLCELTPGSTAVVIGGGMIGLLMVQLAKLSGASRVMLIEPVEAKRRRGTALGADITVDPLCEDAAQVLAAHGITRVNAVIECAGLPSTIEQAIQLAGKKSVVMMFGLTKPEDTIRVRPFELFQKEIVLKASFINPYTQRRALELINSGRVDVHSMLCATVPLEELAGVLSSPERRAQGKYIVKPWESAGLAH